MRARQVHVSYDEGNTPGDYEFLENDTGIVFICPKGVIHGIIFEGHGDPGAKWKWDGNREKPTLTPSILDGGDCCGWHGWLRNGEWVTA